MYALFPNEARTYLTAHQEGAEKAVFLMSEEIHTVREDDSVDVNQIRELIKIVEASDVTEVVIEEGDTQGRRCARAASRRRGAGRRGRRRRRRRARRGRRRGRPRLPGARPATWKTVTAPMVGTFYAAPVARRRRRS